MSKKSPKSEEEKNIYQKCREASGMTRDKASEASEQTGYPMSSDRIDHIERLGKKPYPEEVMAMAKTYKAPELCNHYCTKECAIGTKYIPEVSIKQLQQISLEMLSCLNAFDKEKERLIEITADGEITEDEYADFARIRKKFDQISMITDSLKLWIEKMEADGKIDEDKLNAACDELNS